MPPFKLNKHDRYIQELRKKIEHDYDSVSTNVKIQKKKRSLGEIDILAKKGNKFDIYEVKCSFRITKAKKQTKSIIKHLNLSIKDTYFYCGASQSLILL